MYDYKKSKDVIEEILTSQTKIVEKDKIPASDSEFTYSNGIKTWVGALFVDIVKSSELCQSANEDTARIFRALVCMGLRTFICSIWRPKHKVLYNM